MSATKPAEHWESDVWEMAVTVKEGRRGRTSQLQNDPISFPVLSPHRAFDKSAMADAVSVTSDLRIPPHPIFSTFRAAPTSQLPLSKAVRRAEITILVVAGVRPVRTTAKIVPARGMFPIHCRSLLDKSNRLILHRTATHNARNRSN